MMHKFLIRLAFVLSVCFLLLHNLTPHVHHTEMSKDQLILEDVEARTLFERLMLSFHHDLGGGHLECFEHQEIIQLHPVWNFVIPSDFLLPNSFHYLFARLSDQEVFLKHQFFRLSTMERICHEQHLFDIPPPTA